MGLDRFHKCLSDAGQEFGQRNGSAILGPRCPIHADKELASRKPGALEQDFEIFATAIILDRNS